VQQSRSYGPAPAAVSSGTRAAGAWGCRPPHPCLPAACGETDGLLVPATQRLGGRPQTASAWDRQLEEGLVQRPRPAAPRLGCSGVSDGVRSATPKGPPVNSSRCPSKANVGPQILPGPMGNRQA